MKPHPLHYLFSPRHIAVVGASDRSGSIGQRLFANMLSMSFSGKITPVNRRRRLVGGMEAYARVEDIPDPVDAAVVVIRDDSLTEVFESCARAGVRVVILIKTPQHTQGYREDLLAAAVGRAKVLGIRVLGPSFLGLIRPASGLNASIYDGRIAAGNVAVVSQSSALCSAMLDWADTRGIGFSAVVSLGERAWDVSFGEILDYLVQDADTHAVLLHINQVTHGRGFLSALRAAARAKPVLIIKSGHEDDTREKRVISSEEVFSGVLERAGVLQVHSIAQMFTAVKILAADYRTEGNRLAVVCNGIGLGILAADTAYRCGVPLAALSDKTTTLLRESLPEGASVSNPVDLLGDAGPLRFRTAVQLCLEDENTDGVLVIFSPQTGTDHEATARMMLQLQEETAKPILLSWMGDGKVRESRVLFDRAGWVHFSIPDDAVEVFGKLAEYRRSQQLLLQTPGPLVSRGPEPDPETARRLSDMLRGDKPVHVGEREAKQLLGLFGIPTHPVFAVEDAEAACRFAAQNGYPVELTAGSFAPEVSNPVYSERIKAGSEEDLRAAFLALQKQHAFQGACAGLGISTVADPAAVRELSVCISKDPVFGPVMSLGAGGWAGKLAVRRAVALPPLNDMLIEDMLTQTPVGKTLGPFEGMLPADGQALHHVLLRLSEAVCELPEIEEMTIDPLYVGPEGVTAGRVRLVLAAKGGRPKRYGHMAVMPYPHFLESEVCLRDGSEVVIRPLRPEDADMLQNYVRHMSEESRYNRFMMAIKGLSQNLLVRFTQLDYDRQMALIMVRTRADGQEEMMAVSRYSTDPDMEAGEFAVSVADGRHGQGIGFLMMQRLFEAARHQGLKSLRGEILSANTPMKKLMAKLGFSIRKDPDDATICLVEKSLVGKAEAEEEK